MLALFAVCKKFQTNAVLFFANCKGIVPDLEAEVLGPAVEPLATPIRMQHCRRQPAVAERQRALESALTRVVRFHVQVLEAAAELAQLVAQQALAALGLGVRDHRVPLERRKWFWAKG